MDADLRGNSILFNLLLLLFFHFAERFFCRGGDGGRIGE